MPGGSGAVTTVGSSAPASPASASSASAGLFSDLPFRAPGDIAGWAVAVGAGLTTIAFILPWAQNGVAGGGGGRDYLGQWGLANPANLVLVLVALATLLVTLLPNRLPVEARGIVLPLLVGGLFLGLGWSYLSGPYGTGLGVDTMSVGALLIAAGGVLELRHDRAPTTAAAGSEPRPSAGAARP